MTSKLPDIIGKLVTKTEIDNDSIRLLFADGSVLTVYNKYRTVGMAEPNLRGTISGLETKVDHVVISFVPRGHIEVRLDADAFSGPEAMVYADGTGQHIVVWP